MKTLKDYQSQVAANLFTHDAGLQKVLTYFFKPAEYDRLQTVLRHWEEKLASWDVLASEAARPEKLPRLNKYDRVGRCIEEVILPLETQTIRREVVKTGIFSNASETEKFAKITLLAQIGEAGVTCPLACTDGLIRVIAAQGDDALKKTYLLLLQSMEFPLAGAQFITEQAGGSDVGAIEGVARPVGDGTYRLFAEKWYCSAVDRFFLVAARPEGAPSGTDGVAIFFVPRTIREEGVEVVNSLSIKRLKDKLGTQSLPTAEIDFEGALAYPIGNPDDGFKNLMDYVLNASRLHNAANALGFHRRAFAEARNYAEQRGAFGKNIIEFPLVQQTLVSLLARLTGRRNLFFASLKEIDKHGFLPTDNEQRLWQRFLVNLNKYRTASELTEQVKEAILVFGANGIIQDFSILPRLLRDAMIVETWEGTHNILCLQIMRDAARFDFWGRVNGLLDKILQDWPETVLPKARALYLTARKRGAEMISPEQLKQPGWLQRHARRIVDVYASLLEVGNLVRQGVKQDDAGTLVMASYLVHETFGDILNGFVNPVIEALPEVGLALIREEIVKVDLKRF
jgi:alkylation response protein AidB-like acyl-CoA dehydrogenase